MRTRLLGKLCVTIVVAAFVHTASIRESVAQESKYSPYASPDHPVRAYWGDQHLHSSWSADAATSGTTVGPEEALRFARGEEVTSTTGQRVRLARPLDWLALSDHSDLMGVITEVKAGNPELMKDSVLEQWREQMNAGGEEAGKGDDGPGQEAVHRHPSTSGFGRWLGAIGLVEEHGHHGALQRARPVHCVHRLRMDFERWRRKQPSPQRDLP